MAAQHLSMWDFVSVTGVYGVTEYVDHLHDHFVTPCVIKNGRYCCSVLHCTVLH